MLKISSRHNELGRNCRNRIFQGRLGIFECRQQKLCNKRHQGFDDQRERRVGSVPRKTSASAAPIAEDATENGSGRHAALSNITASPKLMFPIASGMCMTVKTMVRAMNIPAKARFFVVRLFSFFHYSPYQIQYRVISGFDVRFRFAEQAFFLNSSVQKNAWYVFCLKRRRVGKSALFNNLIDG